MLDSTMSVSSLNTKIKSLLETTFLHIVVQGEIFSVTYHSSGHIYFTIKDEKSSLKCVMFRSNANSLKFKLQRGEHIVIHGSIGVYTPRGEYQLYAVSIEPYGQGSLELAYKQLKEKLEKKGYFDKAYKKSQPKYIKKLVLVTSSKGAALQDMLKIIEKRYKNIEVIVVDTLVQGEKAPLEIAKALKFADTLKADAIIVGRGGGSREDLWAFNEEIVADAIFNLKTFVVSAVGHEVDILISDLVADLRAPTPSASIEMLLPDQKELLYMLDELSIQYERAINNILQKKSNELNMLYSQLENHSISNRLEIVNRELLNLRDEFNRVIEYKLIQSNTDLNKLSTQLEDNINFLIHKKNQNFISLEEKLTLYNPKEKQKEGWAEVIKDNKRVKLSDIQKGDRFFLVDINTKLEVECLEKNIL